MSSRVGKESAARGPVLAPELQQPEPPQTKKAQQMDADKKEQGVDSLEKEEGKGARAASGIVPSLDLTRVLGVQNTPSSIVDVETKGQSHQLLSLPINHMPDTHYPDLRNT